MQVKNKVIWQSAGKKNWNIQCLNSHTGWGEIRVCNEYAIINPTFPAISTWTKVFAGREVKKEAVCICWCRQNDSGQWSNQNKLSETYHMNNCKNMRKMASFCLRWGCQTRNIFLIAILSAQVSPAPFSCFGTAKRSPDVVSSWQDYTFASGGRFRHVNCTVVLRVAGEPGAGSPEAAWPLCMQSSCLHGKELGTDLKKRCLHLCLITALCPQGTLQGSWIITFRSRYKKRLYQHQPL